MAATFRPGAVRGVHAASGHAAGSGAGGHLQRHPLGCQSYQQGAGDDAGLQRQASPAPACRRAQAPSHAGAGSPALTARCPALPCRSLAARPRLVLTPGRLWESSQHQPYRAHHVVPGSAVALAHTAAAPPTPHISPCLFSPPGPRGDPGIRARRPGCKSALAPPAARRNRSTNRLALDGGRRVVYKGGGRPGAQVGSTHAAGGIATVPHPRKSNPPCLCPG